ncbi:MAG: ABC transporter permease [Bryobacteraceae bacterium]|nr:ABC transporter permease [Bryobacteraceae bacterium]
MIRVLQLAPVILLTAVILAFALLTPGFLAPRNLSNILVQTSSLAVIATGLTFVLIAGGIDLSAGSVMFLSAAIAGKLALSGQPLPATIAAVLAVGAACGAVNGLMVAKLRLPGFIATLGFLYAGRGVALYITETRAMNLPDELLRLFTSSVAGIPIPVCILIVTTVLAETALSRTAWGLQLYAAGHNSRQALLAGIRVDRITLAVYVISGVAAGLGGLIAVAQLGAVSPTFGYQRELSAIAAAVLGGTSLFGGRGHVFPGTIFGAFLIQTVETGLVMLNADPYLYPMVMAGIILLAVLLDAIRTRLVDSLGRRSIRANRALQGKV